MTTLHEPQITIRHIDLYAATALEADGIEHVALTVLWDLFRISTDDPVGKLVDYTESEQCYGAEIGSTLVGFASLRSLQTSVEVCKLAVSPRVRGRGIGHSLLSIIESEARSEDKNFLCLTALASSVAFYRKNGFYETVRHPFIRMRKDLT